ncbi:MAG: insulinase family protein [Lentisphaeria bacterium]|nr:insulinase family protein [Candidatus Neomarinimicrobiota bacterium]MCF7841665.1 insulinase family protein [Lentisphaeria bacterium]
MAIADPVIGIAAVIAGIVEVTDISDNALTRRETVIANGLRIVTEHVPTVRSVALGIWVKTGSRYEPAEISGISHFLEHMVFKGTETRDKYEIALALESVGGMVNAMTSKDYTCFYARFLEEHLEIAVSLLTDILLNPTFPQEELERERYVVLDELRDAQDVPDEVVFDAFESRIFPNSGLGRPVIGFEETIKNFTHEALNDYRRTHYHPENMVVTASGYVDHDELVALLSQYFVEGTQRLTNHFVDELHEATPGEAVETRSIQQSHLITGRRIFSLSDEKRWPLGVLNAVLSGGMSSRLFQNIREAHGVAYAIYSFANLYRDTGVFGIYLATDPKNRHRGLELVQGELKKLTDEPIAEQELERVKAQYKSGIVMSEESMERRMFRLGRQLIYYDHAMDIDQYLEKIEAVNSADVQSLAQELFLSDMFFTMILEPANR